MKDSVKSQREHPDRNCAGFEAALAAGPEPALCFAVANAAAVVIVVVVVVVEKH